jgi:phosphatidylserine/phosphatidylglycerophosphate/cardiolipin synthase-like enzyme
VRGVVDETQMEEVLRQWRDLPQVAWKAEAFRYVARTAAFGGKRSTPYAPGAMHDYLHAKLVVCDDTLFAGSFNHSRSGEENAENVLQVESAALAREASAFVESAADRYRRRGSDAGW